MKSKLNWNWDLLDTLRTILLTVSIIANCALTKMFWEYRNDYHNRSERAIQDRITMKSNDSVTHFMLRTIIKGQIQGHQTQHDIIELIDTTNKKQKQ